MSITKPPLFAVYQQENLKFLAKWLVCRTYNTVRIGAKDFRGDPIIGLQHFKDDGISAAGVICIKEHELRDRTIEIVKNVSPPTVEFINPTTGYADPRKDFISTLVHNEKIMDAERAFNVTCAVFGFDYKQGQAMLAKETVAA